MGGRGGGEDRSFSSFCKKSLLHSLSHLRSREKILQALLSLSHMGPGRISLCSRGFCFYERFSIPTCSPL